MLRCEIEEQEEARNAKQRIARWAESKKSKPAPRLTKKGGGEKRTSEFKPRGPCTKMIGNVANGATDRHAGLSIEAFRYRACGIERYALLLFGS